MFGTLNWIVLGVYLLVILLIGFIFMHRNKNSNDYYRGGGRIPWWAAGISIYATMVSAMTFMGIPAKAFSTNWTYYPILVTTIFVSIFVIKYYLPYFRRLSITSAYEYLELRFSLTTRLMASMMFIIYMLAKTALVLYIPSLALSAVTSIDILHCIMLMGIITIVYCTVGGIEAVIWGDVIQGTVLVGGAIFLAIWLIINTEGGVDGYLDIAIRDDKMCLFDWSWDYSTVSFWVAIIGGLANNLISYTSDQTVIQRYVTTKDEKSAAHSIMLNACMCILISIVFYVIGTGLYTFFHTHPDSEIPQSIDAIVPYFMMKELPQGIAGLLIAAIFASTMSTLSSNINSVSAAFSMDFYKRFHPNAKEHSCLHVARFSSVIAGMAGVGLAALMATWDILSIIDFFNKVLGLLTSGVGGLFFMGIFLKRIGSKAALCGFVCGTIFVIWLTYCTDVNLFLYGAAGLTVSITIAIVCSYILNEKVRCISFNE